MANTNTNAKVLDWEEGSYVVSEAEKFAFKIALLSVENNEVCFDTYYDREGKHELEDLQLACPLDFLKKPCTTNRNGVKRQYKPNFKTNTVDIVVTQKKGDIIRYSWIITDVEPDFLAEIEAEKKAKAEAKAKKLAENIAKRDAREKAKAEAKAKAKAEAEKQASKPKAEEKPKATPQTIFA